MISWKSVNLALHCKQLNWIEISYIEKAFKQIFHSFSGSNYFYDCWAYCNVVSWYSILLLIYRHGTYGVYKSGNCNSPPKNQAVFPTYGSVYYWRFLAFLARNFCRSQFPVSWGILRYVKRCCYRCFNSNLGCESGLAFYFWECLLLTSLLDGFLFRNDQFKKEYFQASQAAHRMAGMA